MNKPQFRAQTRCGPCTHWRRLLLGSWRNPALWAALLTALMPVVPGAPGAQTAVAQSGQAAVAPTPASPSVPAAAASRPASPAVNSAAPAAAAKLVYRQVTLVVADQGREITPLALVQSGGAPFTLVFDDSKLPPGMHIDEQGVLRGKSELADDYRFTLRLLVGEVQTEQAYLIRVRKRSAAAIKQPPPAPSVKTSSLSQKPGLKLDAPRVWQLTEEDVKTLVTPTEEQLQLAMDAKERGEEPSLPTEDQLQRILEPLIGVEFPTEMQMWLALQSSVCQLYRTMVETIAVEQGKSIDSSCPPKPGSAGSLPGNARVSAGLRALTLLHDALALKSAARVAKTAETSSDAVSPYALPAARPKELPLTRFYAELLGPQLAQKIVDAAEKGRPLETAQAIKLTPADNCGCAVSRPSDEVYGILGWWNGGPKEQEVDFSQLTRITAMGAVLRDEGDFSTAPTPGRLDFVRQAQRHNVAVDLGIYRRNWVGLADWTEQRRADFVRRSAGEAVRMLQTPLQGKEAWLNGLLPTFLGDAPWAFTGLTVFFDDNTVTERDHQAYAQFLQDFVRSVIAQMRRSAEDSAAPASAPESKPTSEKGKGGAGAEKAKVARAVEPRAPRPYRLNIVVPDHLVRDNSAFSVGNLWRIVQLTERVLEREQIEQRRMEILNDREGRHMLALDVEVKFLVLTSEPTSDFKKLLREQLDASKSVRGADRVALLKSMVPVLLVSRAATKPLSEEADKQLRDDVAYMQWNFGGVSLWALPVGDVGHGNHARAALEESYGKREGVTEGLCTFVCPHRLWFRLTLQALVLSTLVLAALFWRSCFVRNRARQVLPAMVILGLMAGTVFLLLLTCDPALAVLKGQNSVLALVFFVVMIALLWRVLSLPKAAS